MDMSTKNALATKVLLRTDFDSAVDRVKEALKTQGFGVLTEIDVKETLKKKIDVDFRRYTILGACNPPLAHQALSADPDVGMLLPCNVTVSEMAEGDVEVAFIDPLVMLSVLPTSELEQIAQDAAERLSLVAEKLEAR